MILGSIDKCLSIIDLLSQNPQGLKLTEIGDELGLPQSTAHHILNTLRQREYVRQDEDTKRYLLGFRFLEISRRILSSLDIRVIAREYLVRINQACGQAVHLAVLNGKKVVYIDKLDAREGLSLATYVGYATDPHAAAGGKVLLSALPESEVRDMYHGAVLKRYGKQTITCLDDLLSELAVIRERGYAIHDEEFYEGVRCVAAPICAGGKVAASLSITGSVFALTPEKIEGEYRNMVVKAAAEISAKLDW
jgi:IclR family transcriptional regulator, KDG regulon repressor